MTFCCYTKNIIKAKIDKLNFIKVKNFLSVMGNCSKMKRQTADREKIFAKDMSDKHLLSKIC
jgi:hypothetical protein